LKLFVGERRNKEKRDRKKCVPTKKKKKKGKQHRKFKMNPRFIYWTVGMM